MEKADREDGVSLGFSPQSSQNNASRTLSLEVSADLIQGIPFRCLLAGAGRPFKNLADLKAQNQVRQCLVYDAFISHDWQTSSWLKFGALLLFFNAKPAAVATLVVSLTIGFLTQYKLLPYTAWAIAIGYITFFLFLCFWQNIRDVFSNPRLAFFDKLSIPQEDKKLKETCVLGLAGFLTCSKQLVILWSDAYIDRLWCMYELTSFMRIHSGKRPVKAIPVALPVLLMVHAAWWFALRMVILFAWGKRETSNENLRSLLIIGTGVLLALLTYPYQSLVGTRMTRNLQELNGKLRSFDVRIGKCSCCSKGHVSETGDLIPCDRELIYQSFRRWYGQKKDMTRALETFNEAVRHKIGDQILLTCGGSQMIPLELFIYVVFSMNTPFLMLRIPEAFEEAEQESDPVQFFLLAMRSLVRSWASVFPGMLMYLWACRLVWAKNEGLLVVRILAGFFAILGACVPTIATFLSVVLTPTDSWLPLVVLIFLMLLGLCLLKPPRMRWLTKKNQESDIVEAEEDSDSFSI